MRALLLTLTAVVVTAAVLVALLVSVYPELATAPVASPDGLGELPRERGPATVNTVRIGTDDPVETAVAVAQAIYPATNEDNIPGAVVLVGSDDLATVMVAASRVQHFPVNAPLLYVDERGLPELTRNELLRLAPEGVAVDRNVQVYLVGATAARARRQVEDLGLATRTLVADDAPGLANVADDWASTMEGDHPDPVAVANLDDLEPAVPAMFWNAHAGDGMAFVTDDGIPEATRRLLERRLVKPYLYVFGDETVVGEEVVAELTRYGHVTRVRGRDAVETSAFFAGFHDLGRNWDAWFWIGPRAFGWDNVDAGRNATFVNLDGPGGWQNAVVATTLSHMGKHAPALVVERARVPEPVRRYLTETIRPYPTAVREQLLNHGWVIGGTGTIAPETQAQLDLLLEAHLERGRDDR